MAAQIPASVLASWAELSTEPAQTRGWGIVVLCAILGTTCVAIVASRLWLRGVVQRSFDVSEWLTLAALLFTLGFLVAACLTFKLYGLDHHLYNIVKPEYENLAKVIWSGIFLIHFAEAFVRLSVLFFYRVIIQNHPSRTLIATLWTVIVIVIGDLLASFIAMFVACRPLPAGWELYNPVWAESHKYQYDNHAAFLLSTAALDAALDVVISLMPIAVLWDLQVPTRQKIAIWALFSMGLFACVAALLRMYWIVVAFYQTYDFTRAAYGILLRTCIELPMALIGSSLPALEVVFSRFFDQQKRSRGTEDRRTPLSTGTCTPSSHARLLPSWLRRAPYSKNGEVQYMSEERKEGKFNGGSSADVTVSDLSSRSWMRSKSVTTSTEVEEMECALRYVE